MKCKNCDQNIFFDTVAKHWYHRGWEPDYGKVEYAVACFVGSNVLGGKFVAEPYKEIS